MKQKLGGYCIKWHFLPRVENTDVADIPCEAWILIHTFKLKLGLVFEVAPADGDSDVVVEIEQSNVFHQLAHSADPGKFSSLQEGHDVPQDLRW